MSGVTFERLPPERRITAPTAASAGSCCCCCCCCLHTVGSLIGALTAKSPNVTETVPTAVVGTEKAEPSYRVTKEYWAVVLLLSTLVLPLYMMGKIKQGRVEEWALVYAILLPAVQLGASVIVGIRNSFSKRPGKHERLRHLGSITVRAFLGTMLGVLVMVVIGSLM